MDKQTFLLEIGCEEIPARFIRDALQQLADRLTVWLEEHRIAFGEIKTYATARRLSVLVEEVAAQQTDLTEEVRGPAARIAKTPTGEWSKAAAGFARKQGVSVEELQLKEWKGETYVFAHKHLQGQKTADVLAQGVGEVITQIHFPKTMRWGSDKARFIRPIRWLVCMLGETVIPIQFAQVTAGNVTNGHRFLGKQRVIPTAEQYVETLRKESVIVDIEERKEMIVRQLQQLEEEQGWQIPVDEDLLEEVLFLVEYPTALFGSFEKEFLSLPKEVLITTMREHQRYFPVENSEGDLYPYFVTVRNGDTYGLEMVAKGNEKVLRARLSDARFFFEEDLKLPIADALETLERIVFLEELGTMGERVRRIKKIASRLGKLLAWQPDQLQKLERAAAICKFDLATQMVGEFSELEGYMGQIYAEYHQEDPQVAAAVYEHHFPRSAGDRLPQGELGTLLALADKIDTIAGSFAVGIQPTGSQDPYGLRRRAAGIVQILLQKDWSIIRLTDLITFAVDRLEQDGLLKVDRTTVEKDLEQFFVRRMKAVLQEQEIRYDVIEAVLGATEVEPLLTVKKAEVLMERASLEAFKSEVEGFTRAANLAKQAGAHQLDQSLFTEEAEQELAQALYEAAERFQEAKSEQDPHQMYQALALMAPHIHFFFDHVMVMVEDPQIRQNRLSLLKEITQLVQQFAAFEHLVFAS
jgi:glycyl-tRNA synthetase beta chain